MVLGKGVGMICSYKEYEEIVRSLSDAEYRFVDLHSFVSCEDKQVILLHDVDFDLNTAYNFCLFEESIGVKSTYFIQISSEFYNCFSEEGRGFIKEISKKHFIGLHFDPSIYKGSLWQALHYEVNGLERIVGSTPIAFNFHRIGALEKSVSLAKLKTCSVINAVYDKRINDGHIQYFSDSHGDWKFGNPISGISGRSMKIVTHPIWWGFAKKSMLINLAEILEGKLNRIRRHISEHLMGC